jgi:hypothetical protein
MKRSTKHRLLTVIWQYLGAICMNTHSGLVVQWQDTRSYLTGLTYLHGRERLSLCAGFR